MKKFGLLVGLTATVSFGAHAQDNNTLKKIEERGYITVAHRESSIPFSYLADGKPVGIGVDVTNKIVDKIKAQLKKPNLEVKLQPVTSQNRIPLLRNGTIDIECGSTTNNSQRGEQVTFAVNYFYTGTRLLAKKSSNIKSFEDLKGKTIASTTGTTNVAVLRAYNQDKNLGMNVIFGKDHDDSLLLVESGRAVAFGMDDILLAGLIASSKAPAELEITGESLQVEPYACMVRKDDPEMKKLVDGVIIDLMKSGEFEKLYKKWFQSPIPPRGANLNFPMSKELQENLKKHSDKPAT
ncbi:transporter substrate-binding domain-containing protein [Parvibium lacunae]|uniref:Amino acid ABC transporter substrate-binding protein n=1 Tax=Parvibium lacunae TaxID=1888893 RepID=A0A368L4D4_9BURK|nr:transporter substrate-binding domain-containing protein [Parvibium lacunae]RCS58441.1 amino acid ABC transporter substrate-binding protein [Parvibium lacunae]